MIPGGTAQMSVIIMRFEVITSVTMKITVFWDVMLCSLVDRYFSEGRPVSFYRVGEAFCPEDGGSRFLRNVGNDLPINYTASHSKRQ
jgi:hypothetical protein